MARKSTKEKGLYSQDKSYWDKVNNDVQSNQSRLSLILGALIVLVVGILVFNYFNRGGQQDLGPAQQTQQQGDVSPEQLPGKYTIKEGDTLFTIAETYYKDGYKYPEIVKANNLTNENMIEVGQVIDIPKLAEASPTSEASPIADATPTLTPEPSAAPKTDGVGGDPNVTVWGPKITGDTYTVIEGDWLSTIAARAYGDIMAYTKIAQANNIQNPDLILPGQVLTIPR